MKKTIVKTLSAFLALVLLLSVLPAAVFAAEADEHAHTGTCCPDSGAAMLGVTGCQHVYTCTFSTRRVNCGSDHRVEEFVHYQCTKCHYSYDGPVENSYSENHTYNIKVLIRYDPKTNLPVYQNMCACGDYDD